MSELTPKTGQKQDFSSKVVTPRNELAQVQLTTDEKKVLVGLAGIHAIPLSQYLRSLISEQYQKHGKLVDKWVKENSLRSYKTPTEKAAIREAILKRHANGESAYNLADEYGYSRGAIYAMVNRNKPKKLTKQDVDNYYKNLPTPTDPRTTPITITTETATDADTATEPNPLIIKWE